MTRSESIVKAAEEWVEAVKLYRNASSLDEEHCWREKRLAEAALIAAVKAREKEGKVPQC